MINKIKTDALGLLIICCVANGAPNTLKSETSNETAEQEKKENRLGTKVACGAGAFVLGIIGRDLKNRSRDYLPDPVDSAESNPDSATTLDWQPGQTKSSPKNKLIDDKDEQPQNRFRLKYWLHTGGHYVCWAGASYMILEMLNARPGALLSELTSIIPTSR